jgi:uncharacterized protein with HEPN domain
MPSTPEDERLRLLAIAERISLVLGWVEGMSEEDFIADLMAWDAAALSLLVIGETARRLRDETKAAAPEVPWSAVVPRRRPDGRAGVRADGVRRTPLPI